MIVSPTIYLRGGLNFTTPISTEKLILIHQSPDELQRMLQRLMHRLLTYAPPICCQLRVYFQAMFKISDNPRFKHT